MQDEARSLIETIRDRAPAMHAQRRLDDDLVASMRGIGIYDMALPASLGGPGLDPLQQFDVIEALSLGDASVGWCAMIGADSGYYPGFFDRATFAQVWPTRNLITAGKLAPSGTARRTGDGWSVTGRWDFGSGSPHADVFGGGVFLQEADGTPITDELGLPQWRAAILPTDAVVVDDTWNTVGLRATGSHDYRVAEPTFVDDQLLFDPTGPMHPEWDEPLFRLPWWFLVKVAGVLTALPRRAIDEAVALAEGKFTTPEMVMLIDRPGTLEAIAKAEAASRSARAFLLDEMHQVWERCVDDGDVSPAATAPMRLAMVQAGQVSAEVCRAMYDLLTTSSIRHDSVLALLRADAEVANTHVATSHRSWVPLGARLVGRDPGPAIYI